MQGNDRFGEKSYYIIIFFIFTVWMVFVDSFSLTPSQDSTQEDSFIAQMLFVHSSKVAFQYRLCLKCFSSLKSEHRFCDSDSQIWTYRSRWELPNLRGWDILRQNSQLTLHNYIVVKESHFYFSTGCTQVDSYWTEMHLVTVVSVRSVKIIEFLHQ